MKLQYYVQEDKGIIVCVGSSAMFDVAKDLGLEGTGFNELEPFLIKNEFKGVARLADGDTWNEEQGKTIARKKVFEKYLTAKKRAVEKYIKEVRRVEKELEGLLEAYKGTTAK